MSAFTNKKIAIIASSAPPIISGGISSAHYNLYNMLKKKGFDARIFTYTDHGAKNQPGEDVIRKGAPFFLPAIILFIGRFYYLVLRLLEKFEFAFQVPYILESAVGSLRISNALKKFRPAVIILPDNGAPGFFIKKIRGSKTVLISHHNPARFSDEPLFGGFSRIDAQLALKIENYSLKKVDKVICPSTYMEKIFQKTHAFKGPVAVIPNLVDDALLASIPAFDVRKKLGLDKDAPVIYIPSAGVRLKGSRFVFEIVRRLAAVHDGNIGFYLSGVVFDGLLKRELGFLPSRVKIYSPGNVSYYDNIAVIKGCSFCISPTLTESFGMAVLEANFCGLPVVAFDTGGIAEIIRHGENGFVVPLLDIESLVSFSARLLHDASGKKIRGEFVRTAVDNFKADTVIRQYIEYIGDGASHYQASESQKTGHEHRKQPGNNL